MNTIDEIIGCIENQDAIDHDDLMVMVAEIARLREQLAAAKAEGRRDALKGVDEILAAKIEWCGGMGGDVERLQIVLEQVRDRLGCTGKATPERCKQSEGSDGDTYAGCVLDAGHDGECEMRARPDRVRAAEPVDACDTAGPCKTCKGLGGVYGEGPPVYGGNFRPCPDCTGKETL